MRTKYKFKYQKEKMSQKYILSEENVDKIANERIFVHIKKNNKKFSSENSTEKEKFQNSENNNISNIKEQNSKVHLNIDIENKNSNNTIINKTKNYHYRFKVNHNNENNNNLNIKNKNDYSSKKNNILTRILTEEKKYLYNNNNNIFNTHDDSKNNSVYNNTKIFSTNRNYHLNNIIKRNNDKEKQLSYSIRNNSIRNYYKNISCNERNNSRKTEKNNNDDENDINKYTQNRLFKRNFMEAYRNKIRKKEKTTENEKQKEKEKENVKEKEKEKAEEKQEVNEKEKEKEKVVNENNNIVKNETINEKKNNKINKFNKIKQLDDVETNTENYLDNNTKKEILVKRTKLENNFKKRTKTNADFNFLVHEAHENQRITLIFNKLYDSTPNIAYTVENCPKNNNNTCGNINNKDIKSNEIIYSDYNNSSIKENINNNFTNTKIKSMKSIYSILKTHSRNKHANSSNTSSNNIMKDYKCIRNYSRDQKMENNLVKKERNESADTTNDDRTSVKTNLSNIQRLSSTSNNYDINNSNDRENYFFKKNNDLTKYKIIYKNNKLKNYFKNNNIEFSEKNSEINVQNQIINNNTYNTTYNIFKINEKFPKQNSVNIDLEINPKITEYKFNSPINKNKNNPSIQPYLSLTQNNRTIIKNNNNNNRCIDFELLFILEEKLKTIINKINNYEICNDECFDWMRFYFFYDFYEKEIDLFQNNNNQKSIISIIKEEILCYFLSYEVSFSQKFNRISILLKAIFQLLHNNYLSLVSFILNNNLIIIKNDENDLVNQLLKIINKELKINTSFKEIINEEKILQIMNENFKQINNYYLMIIDNLYSLNNNNFSNYNSNFFSFPNCLNLDINKFSELEKQNIISLFFYETIKEKHNYSIQDLKKFFNLYLNKAKTSFSSINNYDNISSKNILNKNNLNSNNNNLNNSTNHNYAKSLKLIHSINYIPNKSFLPPIQKPYIYTLVLDLDETLIHYKTDYSQKWDNLKQNMIILRPDLIYFLKEMKKIYELVLFSYATYDYIDKILKIVESKEKFFEYILDRRHITYENGSYIKNLSLIGRDLKNVIIIDDKPQAFKMHKENGIFIKPFYGDCFNNKNILKNLTKILKDIRKDADINGDIRKCIQNKNHEIFTKITTGLIE